MINGFYFKWALNFNIVTPDCYKAERSVIMAGVQISDQSGLHLMRVHPNSSFCKFIILSNQEPHSSSIYPGRRWSTSRETLNRYSMTARRI